MSESFDSAVSVRDEVVERVARAIFDAITKDGNQYVGGKADDIRSGPIILDCDVDFMACARAAIKAYAEATRGWSVE